MRSIKLELVLQTKTSCITETANSASKIIVGQNWKASLFVKYLPHN